MRQIRFISAALYLMCMVEASPVTPGRSSVTAFHNFTNSSTTLQNATDFSTASSTSALSRIKLNTHPVQLTSVTANIETLQVSSEWGGFSTEVPSVSQTALSSFSSSVTRVNLPISSQGRNDSSSDNSTLSNISQNSKNASTGTNSSIFVWSSSSAQIQSAAPLTRSPVHDIFVNSSTPSNSTNRSKTTAGIPGTHQSSSSSLENTTAHQIPVNTTQQTNISSSDSTKQGFRWDNYTSNNLPSNESQTINITGDHALDLSTLTVQKPKAVFAHYLVGTVTAEHANQDIDEAIAMGLDGFALNIGDPAGDWLPVSLDNLFGYAEFRGFKLFVSLDVYASGDACSRGVVGDCGGPDAFDWILTDRLSSPSWYLGTNSFPLISTYSSGGGTHPQWLEWYNTYVGQMYFIPDFDETLGYYTADPGWYAYWGDLINGVFSWESAWPFRAGFGGLYPGDISPDLPVQSEMAEYNKSYMMPLSTLQYKNAYGANVYRAGDLNLPTRMENILSMQNIPDFIQVLTWNDGPEGHYIGNLWLEQNNDTAPMRYANIEFPHNAWQPLITSFIQAYKNGKLASEMSPPEGVPAVGAMWYKTILQSSICPSSPNPSLYNDSKPDGFDTGTDQLNYALVLPVGASGYSVQAVSNGAIIGTANLGPGLNYGSFSGVVPGWQRMELYHDGSLTLAATGGRCISADCPDCVYNMNPQVVGFLEDTGDLGTCPYQSCQRKAFAHYMVGNIYEAHAHQDIDDAAAMGLDGFALNVGDPTQPFVRQTFDYMFDYTRDNHPDFKLFMSMDLWAEGNAFQGVGLSQYYDLLQDFLGHEAWLLGPNGFPFLSTYSSGGLNNTDWTNFKNDWGDVLYFVPDFDDTAGYNTSDPGWWAYWGDVVDGAMSWETAWPEPGVPASGGNISLDEAIVAGTFYHRKSYMMPFSALQYKDSGDLNLPMRMEAILEMPIAPDFVEYITWNDGPESHYIGNLWEEQNNDTQPGLYASSDVPHTAWQPLITSFIEAFKSALSPEEMIPPPGNVAIGAIWYNSIMTTSVCPHENLGGYYAKPTGFQEATDSINFAVVLGPTEEGVTVQAISNGIRLAQTFNLKPGLNYGSFEGISAGYQSVELLSASGSVLLTAAGGRCISNGCPDCVYNLNPIVVGFSTGSAINGECYQRDCSLISSPQNSTSVIYLDPVIYSGFGFSSGSGPSSPSGSGPGTSPSSSLGSGPGSDVSVACPSPPCTYILPPIPLSTTTTISFPESTTSLEIGCFIPAIFTDGFNETTSTVEYVSITVTTVLTVPAVTLTSLPVSNVPIVSGVDSTVIYAEISVNAPPFIITDDDSPLYSAGYSCISSPSNTRSIMPKPWPWMQFPLPGQTTTLTPTAPFISFTHITSSVGPICSDGLGCGTFCQTHCSWPCSSGCNTNGADCTAATCTQGGDCAGPTCTAGGDCSGPNCSRGGDCTGPKCDHGGGCNGPKCHRAGSCWGLSCSHGGGCTGPLCAHGGGCGPLGCTPGSCSGPKCSISGNDDDDEEDDDDQDFIDSNNPNSVSSEQCTTSTFSSCETLCIADPSTSCAQLSTSCGKVVGCDTTGTAWASTITPAPGFPMGYLDTWDTVTDDPIYDMSAAESIISFLSAIGDFGSMSTPPVMTSTPTTTFIPCTHYNADPDQGVTEAYCVCSSSTFAQSIDADVTPVNSCAYTTLPTSTISPIQSITTTISSVCSACTYVGISVSCTSIPTCTVSTTPTTTSSIPYPTNTAENAGGALCYSNSNGNYVSFTQSDAEAAIAAFCNADYSLQPGDPVGRNEAYMGDGYLVHATASWASDQSGCNPEGTYTFLQSGTIFCLELWSTDYFCEDENGEAPTSYGGGYVLKPPSSHGCILFELYALPNTNSPLMAPLVTKPGTTQLLIANISTAQSFRVSQWRNKTSDPTFASSNDSSEHRPYLVNSTSIARLYDVPLEVAEQLLSGST